MYKTIGIRIINAKKVIMIFMLNIVALSFYPVDENCNFLYNEYSMFKNNRNLVIIAVIALVNSIGYGVIIPIMLPYAEKFGLSSFQYGFLFALFSVCQFLSTPVIGRLSDKYGRKPLLSISIAGTAVSFFMAAFSPNALFLFLARAIDGLTSGNIPVAQAVISDTTEPKDRAKGFGIIGASFGVGFIAGPVIAAVALPFGMGMPFIVAGVISVIAVALTVLYLPETNKHIGQVPHGKMFDLQKLVTTLFDKDVGGTLIIWLVYACTFGMFIISFQTYAVNALKFNASQIAQLFAGIGVVQLVMQAAVIPWATKKASEKHLLLFAFGLSGLFYLGISLIPQALFFIIANVGIAIANSFVMPLINSLLSKEVDSKSQGSIFGVSSSYLSVGTVIGPVLAGAIASLGVGLPFLLAFFFAASCLILSAFTLKNSYTHHGHLPPPPTELDEESA
jgi:MFS family permease